MEVRKWTYDEYPEFPYADADGILETDGDEMAVKYFNDVEYVRVDGYSLHLQILIPFSRNHPIGSLTYPTAVYVKGSHWAKQNTHDLVPQVSKLSERGFVVAVVEYRGYDRAVFPSCIMDAQNAVRFLRKHAREYCVDPEKMIMMGNSSGGHTAVYTAILNSDDTEDNLYPGISSRTSCIIDLYGSVSVMAEDANPSTLDHCLETSPEGMEMGGVNLRERNDLRRKLSCECNITTETDMPPVLIMHGTKDRTVNPSGSAVLYEQLKSTGHEAYFYLVKGADHGGAEFSMKSVTDLEERFIRSHI
jgi:acetyl esterase/lipase